MNKNHFLPHGASIPVGRDGQYTRSLWLLSGEQTGSGEQKQKPYQEATAVTQVKELEVLEGEPCSA